MVLALVFLELSKILKNGVKGQPNRQWPEVYDSCHTFLHVARVRKHTDMRELHAFLAQRAKTCDKI